MPTFGLRTQGRSDKIKNPRIGRSQNGGIPLFRCRLRSAASPRYGAGHLGERGEPRLALNSREAVFSRCEYKCNTEIAGVGAPSPWPSP